MTGRKDSSLFGVGIGSVWGGGRVSLVWGSGQFGVGIGVSARVSVPAWACVWVCTRERACGCARVGVRV
eukprot:6200655-Pleurochrysis_carterae.AAC.4